MRDLYKNMMGQEPKNKNMKGTLPKVAMFLFQALL